MMKRTIPERLTDMLLAAVLSFAVGYTNLLLFQEILGIPVPEPVSPIPLLAAALIFSLAAFFPHPGRILAVGGILGTGLAALRWKGLGDSFRGLLYALLRVREIRAAASLLFPELSRSSFRETLSIRAALLATGAVVIWLTVLVFLTRVNPFFFTAFNAALLIGFCVVRQTEPPGIPFLGFLAAHLYLLLSHLIRKRRGEKTVPIHYWILLPSVALPLLCGLAASRADRPEWTGQAVQRITHFFSERFDAGRASETAPGTYAAVTETLGTLVWNSSPTNVNLSLVGPRSHSDTPAMEIYSDLTRTYYLRGIGYNWYDGTDWYANGLPVIDYQPPYLPLTQDLPTEELFIRTAKPTRVLYLPYTPTELPAGSSLYFDNYIYLPKRTQEYHVFFKPNAYYAPVSSDYYRLVYTSCTSLLDSTIRAVADITALFDPADPDVVFDVANYVRNSAYYDQSVRAMPEEEEDFAAWFLNDCDAGYCVHFATAAAVLLRSLGIPARYVTGYMIEAKGGEWTTVTQDNAHAWVEYFDDANASWRMLEVTASVEAPGEEAETTSDGPLAPLPNLRPEQTGTTSPEEDREQNTAAASPRRSRFSPVLAAVIPVCAVLLLWPFALRLIRRIRNSGGDTREKILIRYRRALRYARIARRTVSEEARETAYRARFSSHPATEEELRIVTDEEEALVRELKSSRNPLRWLRARWLLGL